MWYHWINIFYCPGQSRDTVKFTKNTLYILRYSKRHLSGWNDVKHWKNQAHSLSMKTPVSQSVSQSVKNPYQYKKGFWVNLKACFVLTNTAHRRQGKLRLVSGSWYFIDQAYSFVVPTMNHHCDSWYHVAHRKLTFPAYPFTGLDNISYSASFFFLASWVLVCWWKYIHIAHSDIHIGGRGVMVADTEVRGTVWCHKRRH